MPGPKSRPVNNFHCFEGLGRPYWLAIARGFRPSRDPRMGTAGASWDLQEDSDGYTLQNGGMFNPQEAKLQPGHYFYRFFGSIDRNKYGTRSSMSGGWWIDHETAKQIEAYAHRLDYPIAKAAAQLLVLPKEWQDCAWLGRALLTRQMKVFVGKGKPATGNVSPDSATARSGGTPVIMGLPHLEIKQMLMPGTRAEIAAAFQPDQFWHVIKTGVSLT